MTSWPDKPLIRIIKGSIHGSPIDGKFAVRTPHGGYGVDTHFLPQGRFGARIDEWEDMTPVPTTTLKHLRDVFLGVELPFTQFAAIQQAVSHLPADKPSALDRAVSKVKSLGETPLILKGFPQEYDLALLLESLAALQVAVHKGPALAKIVLVCTTWVDFLSLGGDSLDHVSELAESDADRAEFTAMVRLAGDIASSIGDGLIAKQKQHLLAIAQYALVWLAELIEKEEA